MTRTLSTNETYIGEGWVGEGIGGMGSSLNLCPFSAPEFNTITSARLTRGHPEVNQR